MKKIIIRIVAALFALLVVVMVAAFVFLNAIVKKTVESRGPQMAGVAVRLDAVDLSPFSGSGSLSGLFVGNPDGFKTPFALQVGKLKVAVKLGSVMSDTIVVDEINIQNPDVYLEGTLDGNNLGKILDNLTASSTTQEQQKNAPPPPGQTREKKFIVRSFTLNGAKLHLELSGFEKNFNQTVSIPDYHLQDIGLAEGGVSAAELSKQMFQPVLDSAQKAAREALLKKGLDYLGTKGGGAINKAVQAAAGVGSIVTNLLK